VIGNHQQVADIPLPDAAWRQALRRRLGRWYARGARDFPWRRTRDPYQVWVSEIMLQQTQTATVVPYFERFIHAFPTVHSLAAAPEEEVLRLWEGLGYYRRARQLKAAAAIVVRDHRGQIPQDAESLESLPGIGRYTAGAILSIAWDQRQPILEANTIRLWSRLLAYRGDPASAAGQRLLWEAAATALPRSDVGRFNQALMELGSQVCLPRDPHCGRCPLASLCPTRAGGLQDEIPRQKKRAQTTSVREAVVVVRKKGQVLMLYGDEAGRWAGMWDFPRFPLAASRGQSLRRELIAKVAGATGVQITPGDKLLRLKHGVTRFRITLDCYEAQYVARRARSPRRHKWINPERLREFPLHVTGRKLGNLIAEAKR
jgi:A/G-specific adenine glycosylase